jgi:hypothetical protein
MLDFDLERLNGRKLFVGTPMYNGQCHWEFAFSIAQLTALCTQLNISLRLYFVCHEALITKARNITTDEFLRSGCDNLVFIDADIGFDARDVIHLLALQVLDESDRRFDVVAAPYPLKRISWDRVLQAAKAGLADEDPELLARYSSAVAISPAYESTFPISEPVEVTQAGTGLMMIRRETFERYRDHYFWQRYCPENIGIEKEVSSEICAFFETEIDSKHGNILNEAKAFLERFPQSTPHDVLDFLENGVAMGSYSGKHVSEDYAFCRRVREIGMKVWLCPWMELTHTGSHQFTSRLVDLNTIGVV